MFTVCNSLSCTMLNCSCVHYIFLFVISVFSECCRAGWGDSRLSEEHNPVHLRASAQIPHRLSQGGGAATSSVVRFCLSPHLSLQGFEHIQWCVGLVLVQFLTSYTLLFNEFFWHLVWEGNSVPLDDLRSYCLHGNSHAAPKPAFSSRWVSSVWSP